MSFDRVLVATDESAVGRNAVAIARSISRRLRSRLSILSVCSARSRGEVPAGGLVSTAVNGFSSPELAAFQNWLGRDADEQDAPEVAVAFGVTGIEVTRFVRLRESSLLVLGRRPRSPDRRLLLGETADAVVRRCETPVLFVPPDSSGFSRLLVALDGTERAIRVLATALELARDLDASLEAITVEPALADETDGSLPRARSLRLTEMLRRAASNNGSSSGVPLIVRRGNPIDEILAYAEASRPDALIIGYRRGGPPEVMGPTDIARNLLYAAPTAVLTVPL